MTRSLSAPAASAKNYITPAGCQRLKDELLNLLNVVRPDIVKIVSWAASNGDRSENADYQYGKKRLREIDRRIYFLTKRIEAAVVVDPLQQENVDRIFFGATVSYCGEDGVEKTISIVGQDEVDSTRGLVSWVSPIAKAMIKAQVGDEVICHTPHGEQVLEILDIQYVPIELSSVDVRS